MRQTQRWLTLRVIVITASNV